MSIFLIIHTVRNGVLGFVIAFAAIIDIAILTAITAGIIGLLIGGAR